MTDMTLSKAALGTAVSPKPFAQSGRSLLLQGSIILALAGVLAILGNTAVQNLARQGTASGFAFLDLPVPFRLSETFIPLETGATYLRAFLAGFVNTISVAGLAVVLATIAGFLVGFARLSKNGLLSGLSSIYVEWMRNVPLILHLSLWYLLLTTHLPTLRNAFQPVDAVFLSNRGLQLPKPVFGPDHVWMLAGLFLGIAASLVFARRARKERVATGRRRAVFLPCLGIVVALTGIGYVMSGASLLFDVPARSGLAIRGGATLSPEFVVLVLGLAIYTSGFIAEIVRAGILSVAKGQAEAARALGLHSAGIMWLVVLPQALRVMLPSLTTQFTNLIKNSSLAVIIGYPDLVSVTNTSLNQTGQAIECIAIMMLLYVLVNSAVSGTMSLIERRTRIVTR